MIQQMIVLIARAWGWQAQYPSKPEEQSPTTPWLRCTRRLGYLTVPGHHGEYRDGGTLQLSTSLLF
jgi:hypothetical protein